MIPTVRIERRVARKLYDKGQALRSKACPLSKPDPKDNRQDLCSALKDRYNAGTSMDPLSRLFGSFARLKLLRLFLFNEETAFTITDIAFRTKTPKDQVRKELTQLVAAEVVRKRASKAGAAYGANKRFTYYEPLLVFLRSTTSLSDTDIINTLKKAGAVRVIAMSGLFTGAVETKVDILIVGDNLDDKKLETAIHSLEAHLGRELSYAAFTTQDFRYRVGVYDRLVRDVFDYPHRTILDKIGIRA
jgi:hypothetical protein